MKVKLCMAIIDMPRNIGLKLGGVVVTAKPEVVIESANACACVFAYLTGAAVHVLNSANCVYSKETILCSHLPRSKESATT